MDDKSTTDTPPYEFEGGFPTAETVRRARDDADLSRAVEAYRFFFPAVSGLAIWQGTIAAGVVPNEVFGLLDTRPEHVGLTLNSDTPYGPWMLDLRDGPIVVEVPPGPLMGVFMDLDQRWLADVGLPGPDAGQGGQFVVLPPGWTGDVPVYAHPVRAGTYRVIGGIRAIPVGGDLEAAHAVMARVRLRPLTAEAWAGPEWPDMTGKPQDTSPNVWQSGLGFWRALHEIVESEPHAPEHGAHYGLLAALGIARDRPFDPEARTAAILERAAVLADGQMRVEAFADDRPDRVVWPDTQWEWPVLRPENAEFWAGDHLDVHARERWFVQAIATSPAMFRRGAGAGSVYWLSARDASGTFLEGGRSYRLVVPRPVPAQLFWSVTVYDAATRSQIEAPQGRAALRSLFELAVGDAEGPVELRFAPDAPEGDGDRWVQTRPGRGWFVYFRVYGPEAAAFDGGWRLPDIEAID